MKTEKQLNRDFELLSKLSKKKLAKIWGILNTWGWPEEIPDPEGYEGERRGVLMKWINNTIGHKECLKYANVIRKKSMTEKEFEKWWIKNAVD